MRSRSNINGVQRLLIDLVLICVRNFLRVKVFPGPISMTSKDGSHSIQAKLNLSTKLVDNYWEVDDANSLRCEGDIPSIGILLCKDKDSSVVEWSLRGITTPLGVYGKNGY